MELKRQKKKSDPGFVMIEAIISIFIVGIALVTFMTVLGRMYMLEFNKRDYTIAASLAQEGLEIVRNIRDNNWKETPAKNAFDAPFPAAGSSYCYDYANDQADSCGYLKQNDSGFYNYSSGSVTKFKRTIAISNDGEAKKIKSTVTWRPKGASADISIDMETKLYPWGDK